MSGSLLPTLHIASSMLALGAATVLAVYYRRWWRDRPEGTEGAPPAVISAFAVWLAGMLVTPMITTLTVVEQRAWRVPLNVALNLFVTAILLLVCRGIAATRERERRGG